MTYRSFATSFDLLEGLAKRLESLNNNPQKKIISFRVFNVFKHWFERAWYDFEKDCPELYNQTILFFDRCIKDESLKTTASSVKNILTRKMNNGDEKVITSHVHNLKPILPKDPTCDILEIHSEEIARQLTIVEWEIWSSIQPWECLSLAWTKSDKFQKAPNVINMIERFNWVSGWVASTICTTETTKKRTKAINKFIEIANKLFEMNNVNAVMEIVSGLNRGPVYRLKQSWENVPGNLKKSFEELKTLTDRSKNYFNMRKHLKNINPPLLPYLGIYLTDLTFIEEGNNDEIKGLINFYKRHLISETIRSIKQYQLMAYNFEKIEFIQDKLRNIAVYDEDKLYELSEYLEPRAGKERGRRPSLLDRGLKKKEEENHYVIDLEEVNGVPYSVPESPQNIVLHDDGTIKHATIQKLVEYLTHHVRVDVDGVSVFFSTYRSFATPKEILDLLIHRFNIPPPKDKSPANMEKYKTEMQSKIYLRVFVALKTWIEKHYSDFSTNEQLKVQLINFIEGTMKRETPNFANTLLSSLMKQQQTSGVYLCDADQIPPASIPSPRLDINTATLFDFDEEEMARQLCIFHHKLFIQIRPNEMLGKAYKQPNKETIAPNIISLLGSASTIKSWVEREINRHEDKVSVIAKFSDISRRCLTHQNLLAARAISSALTDLISNKSSCLGNIGLETLPPNLKQTLLEDSDLYKSAKNLKTKVETLSPPCVPTVETYLHDIVYNEENYGADIIPERKINFEKKRHCAEPIKKMMEKQKMAYNFAEIPLMQQFILNLRSDDVSRSESMGSFSMANTLSTSGGDDSPQLQYFMIDILANDDEFKKDIQDLAVEAFRLEEDKIREEFKSILNGNIPTTDFSIKPVFPVKQQPQPPEPVIIQPVTPKLPPLVPQSSQTPPTTINKSHLNDTRLNHSAPQSPVNSPLLSRNVKGSPNVKIPLSQLKSRSSFTSASKQPGMKDLLNSLGKSPSISISSPGTSLSTTPHGTPPNSMPSTPGPLSFNSQPTTPQTPLPSNTSTLPQTPSTPNNGTPLVRQSSTPLLQNIDSEGKSFDDCSKALIERDFPGSSLETWECYDESGTVYGMPCSVSSQILKKDKVYICNIRESVEVPNILETIKIGKLYKTLNPSTQLACVIITSKISPEAEELAAKFKIKVYQVV